MAHTNRSKSPPTHSTTLAIRTRDPLAQNDIVTPVAGEAIRERWTEEQRRLIAENEAALRQLAEIEPRVGSLSIQPNLQHGDDLTVREQIAVIHGGATPAQYAANREMLLERQRQDIIDHTSPISPPVSPACPHDPQIKAFPQTRGERTSSLEYDDFPELDAKYGPPPTAGDAGSPDTAVRSRGKPPAATSCEGDKGTSLALDVTDESFPQSQSADFIDNLCTGPCPVQTPHHRGAYLRQGQVPRVWNERWGYSDPPRETWEAWVRIERGHGSSWDEVEVDGFARSHWWAGP